MKKTRPESLLSADPSVAVALCLWGVDVLVTTGQPVGNVQLLAPAIGLQAFIREALSMRSGFVGDDLSRNK